MNPREFEEAVAARLRHEGYTTELGKGVGDYGVDVFAAKDGRRYAVQAKMFGRTARPVNRQMMMELHGAAAYFGCAGAMLATDGRVLADAAEVARKLGIRIIDMGGAWTEQPAPAPPESRYLQEAVGGDGDFATIWSRYVLPLAGATLTRPDGSSNTIVTVDWSGVERITSNGQRGRIKIEIFEWAVDRVLRDGCVSRAAINDQYQGRASSGVVLILAQVPLFEVRDRPLTLWRKPASGPRDGEIVGQ
jgi:restriction system protein